LQKRMCGVQRGVSINHTISGWNTIHMVELVVVSDVVGPNAGQAHPFATVGCVVIM
jgi:hypothetical protein